MKKGIFAILFLGLMAAVGGAAVILFVKTNMQEEKSVKKEETDVPVVSSFKEQYPFEEERKKSDASDETWMKKIDEYKYEADNIKEKFDMYSCNLNPLSPYFKKSFHNINIVKEREFTPNGNNTYIRLKNGYFTYIYPYSHPTEMWENLIDFVTWLKEHDRKYLSLIAADKGDDTYTVFPERVPHGYARMAKEYKAFLEENDIEYLESRERLIAQNSNFYYWFYKTDHHWNVHAGILVAQETVNRLNDMGVEADRDAIKRENFTLKIYPKSFLGSMGWKLGESYKEDMEIYYPTSKSRFHLQIPSMGIDREGTFSNTLISGDCLSKKNSSYSAFLYGDQPLIQIENMLANNTTRVLVIKQSKANIVCPYLAFTVKYLDIIDPRYFDGSIRKFTEKTNPDIVITCVDVPYEGNEEFWILK